jgi:hypothetical protein
MAKDDGGPAFPRPHTTVDANSPWFKLGAAGMSLRDWFAGMALAGIAGECLKGSGMVCDEGRAKTVAMCAFEYADAMLKARKRD